MTNAKIEHELIEAHVERLRTMRKGGRTVPTFAVDQTARILEVSRRTLWRWIAEGAPKADDRAHKLTDDEIRLYYDLRGNVAAVARELAGRPNAPSRRTLARAFANQLSAAERAYVVRGTEGARSASLYLRWEAEYRNQIWESDHKELPIEVVPRRGHNPVKPWVTLFEDAKTRAVMGAALVPRRPTRAEVLAALRSAVTIAPERGPFGGRPDVLVWDNGLEFLANDVDQVALELGCNVTPTDAYTPTQKGKIERFNRTLEQELISTLPFYTHGPRAANGKLFGPKTIGPMSFEKFSGLFFDYIWKYNNERGHSALGGCTPLSAWREDPTPLVEVDPVRLRWMLPSVNRKILKDGIHHDNHIFWSPNFRGLVGRTVEVRFMPYDNREIEVFLDGKWLTTAVPFERVTTEQRKDYYKGRRDERKQMAGRMRSSSRRSAARLVALTEPGEVPDGDPLAAAQERLAVTRRRNRKPAAANLAALGIDGLNEAEGSERSDAGSKKSIPTRKAA